MGQPVRFAARYILAGLILLLATSESRAQQAATPELRVFVLRGEGGVNRIALGLVPDIIVEVRDSNDFPVDGAEVIFRAPVGGPGGTFKGDREYRARTNADGQTAALGFIPNNIQGRFQLEVEAVSGERRGRTVVNLANSAKDVPSTVDTSKRRNRNLLLWGLIGGGAAAGITIWATWDSSPNTVTLTPGAVSIGVPR